MKTLTTRAVLGGMLLLATLSAGLAQRPAGTPASGPATKPVTAAESFLAALDQNQRAKVLLPLNEKTRIVWSNLPTGVTMQVGATERNGLKFGNMSASQQQSALALVASVLSPAGYQKVVNIVNGDQRLEEQEGPATRADQQSPIRAGGVLSGHPRHPVADRPLDPAVRRTSSGHQRHDCRRR